MLWDRAGRGTLVRRVRRNRRSEQTSDWLKVHKATQYQRVKDNAEMKKELKSWFDFLDKDGSGEITVEELEDPLISMGLAKNRAEVESLVNKVDWDGSTTWDGSLLQRWDRMSITGGVKLVGYSTCCVSCGAPAGSHS